MTASTPARLAWPFGRGGDRKQYRTGLGYPCARELKQFKEGDGSEQERLGRILPVNHEHTHEKLKKQFSNYDHRHQRAGSYGKYALGAGLVQTARLTGSDDH